MKIHILLFLVLSIGYSCKKDSSSTEEPIIENSEETVVYYTLDEFAMGVDLSYVNQVEDYGGEFRDSSEVRDVFRIMSEHGANIARVRLWHNPDWVHAVYDDESVSLYSGFADVEKTIRRAKQNGMAVCLDIHYSDTWADPGNQIPPKAWQGISDLQVLKDSVYSYTHAVLSSLNAKGLMPEMVQIGNEINCGFMISDINSMFPVLNVCDNYWSELGEAINSGIRAVRDVESRSSVNTEIALHVADPKNLEWWFGNITTLGGVTDFDIIGLSYYPLWHTAVLFNNLPSLISSLTITYQRKVMIMETAYPWTTNGNDSYNNLFGGQTPLSAYPFTKDGQANFLKDLTNSVMDAGGKGIMYWEPAWVSSQLKDRWGQGSSWENCTFFDFDRNFLPSINYMNKDYRN